METPQPNQQPTPQAPAQPRRFPYNRVGSAPAAAPYNRTGAAPAAPATTAAPARPYQQAQQPPPRSNPNDGQVVIDGAVFRKEVVADAEERMTKILEFGRTDEKTKARLRHAVSTAFPTADDAYIDRETATVVKCAEMTISNKGNTSAEMISWLSLMAAKPESVWGEVIKIAQMGLRPDHITKEAWLTPKTSKGQTVCVGIPGVRGLEKILARSGKLDSISGRVIRVGDEFDFVDGTEPKIIHKPAIRKEAAQPQAYDSGGQSSAQNIQNTITGAWVCIRIKGCSTPEISVREYTPPSKRKFMTQESDALFAAKREAMRNAIRHHCVDSQSAAMALTQIAESEKLADEAFAEASMSEGRTRPVAQKPTVEFVASQEQAPQAPKQEAAPKIIPVPQQGESVDDVITGTISRRR